MPDTQQHGVMAMVKIDGGKVRQLREQKSLTQLYVATAVQVTTDTISRWENRRYPTIKKENAVKLAEALEVDLAELLDKKPPPSTAQDCSTNRSQNGDDGTEQPKLQNPKSDKGNVFRHWPILLLSATLSLIMAFAGWVFLESSKTPAMPVSVKRVLPAHCVPGQSFPVIIEVTVQSHDQTAFIVKEELPKGVTIINAHPDSSNPNSKGSILKWLTKGSGRQIFTYTAMVDSQFMEEDEFSGGITIGGQTKKSYTTSGDSTLTISNYHWADSNRDNVIDDSEILSVYDQFGELNQLAINLESIEEIWLGSGYRWNPSTHTYDILP